jgi:uncharacterized protein YeaO (DUF488 family)
VIQIKRVYEQPEKSDGRRILVDRLWPRGVKKSELEMDDWAKDLAPSPALRKQFGHKPENWKWFRSQYKKELRDEPQKEKLEALAQQSRKTKVTLLYAAHDEKINHARVLKEVLDRAAKAEKKKPKLKKSKSN